jgi:hypothetical protein
VRGIIPGRGRKTRKIFDKKELIMDYKSQLEEATINGRLKKELFAMRQNFEAAGRPVFETPFYKNKDYTREGILKMFREDPTLAYHYSDKKQLCKEGKITWAAMIQANTVLLDLEEPVDSYAVFYVSDCEFYDNFPMSLHQVAKKIYEYKHNGKTDNKVFEKFGEYLRDEEGTYLCPAEGETGCHLNLRHNSGDKHALFTCAFVVRDQLYCRVLRNKPIPVLHLPQKCYSTIILPVAFWTKTFKDFYIPESQKAEILGDYSD